VSEKRVLGIVLGSNKDEEDENEEQLNNYFVPVSWY
jgi:hypothetical protein